MLSVIQKSLFRLGLLIVLLGIPAIAMADSQKTVITFANQTSDDIMVYWVNSQGKEVFYAKLAPSKSYDQNTYVGHVWRVRSADGGELLAELANSSGQKRLITLTDDDGDDNGGTGRPPITSGEPPFHGQVFVSAFMLTDQDPSSLIGLEYLGHEPRKMFDRRIETWKVFDAHLFLAEYDDSDSVEIQVNPEFSRRDAEIQAKKYAVAVGRLPSLLRERLKTLWIHRGYKLFGGGSENILIHTEQGDEYLRQGFLDEALCHEASHTSLDPIVSKTKAWKAAQAADGAFISKYAKENPDREDVAESFCLYYGVAMHSDRLDTDQMRTIRATMPNRIRFFSDMMR